MQRILFMLLLQLSVWLTAQNHRFIYEYRYIPNINEKDKMMTDLMALDITKTGSRYRSLTKLTQDSARQAQIQEMIKKGGGFSQMNFKSSRQPGMVEYEVLKDYPNNKVYLIQPVSRDTYKVLEDEDLIWKISSEKQKIGDYQAQKATADFGGRSWIAWFTQELPFQDGPYKFSGLPGMIVKLEDTTGSHTMTLVANRKTPEANSASESVVGGTKISFGKEPIQVSEQQFKKAWSNYILDPAKELRAGSSVSADGSKITRVTVTDGSGKPLDTGAMMKTIEENLKKQLAKDNNKIEPSLYK